MSESGFNLPLWSELSQEQEDIVTLSTTKDYVIQGSPGTGKTVMALYRAAKIAEDSNCTVPILVYNAPLARFLETVTKTDPRFRNVTVGTYHSWLSSFYQKTIRKKIPKYDPDDRYSYNWEEVVDDCLQEYQCYTHVIIDEAQDFPIEMIRILKHLARNITCFIDPNQAIEANKTAVIETLKELCIECPWSLTRNYRNTRQIAELSKLYWSGSGTFAKPEPNNVGRNPRMVKFRMNDYDDQTRKMANIIRNNIGLSIGVLVNSKNIRATFKSLEDELDGEVDVEMYKTQTKDSNIDFTKKNVKIISFGTMKGLEFDLVIISRMEKMRSTGDQRADNNRAYVAITRAMTELVITYCGERCTVGWADVMNPISTHRTLVDWEN